MSGGVARSSVGGREGVCGGVEAGEWLPALLLLRLKGFLSSSLMAADRDFRERESDRWCWNGRQKSGKDCCYFEESVRHIQYSTLCTCKHTQMI